MYNRSDPRFRRRLAQLTSNLESATESTQVGLFSFTHHYIRPCLSVLSTPFEPCLARCFPSPEERKRRRRDRDRGRGGPEYSFDFYDDWAEDETDALLSLEGEEFERVMGGSTSDAEATETITTRQPDRQKNMTYGTRPRKRSLGRALDPKDDPTIIPSQSRFGFLSRLGFRSGTKGLRYKPSAADLQERPHVKDGFTNDGGARGGNDMYHDDDSSKDNRRRWQRDSRVRSTTAGSGHTTDSYSSRGDIFPSDDEADADAVPLGDEFAVAMLQRRNTYDDGSSGRTGGSSAVGRKQRPGGTRSSTRTMSSRSKVGGKRRRSGEVEVEGPEKRGSEGQRIVLLAPEPDEDDSDLVHNKEGVEGESKKTSRVASMADLKAEEAKLQADEEAEIERRRESAMRLAKEKGLSVADVQNDQQKQMQMRPLSSPSPHPSEKPSSAANPSTAFPFPNMPLQELKTPRGSKDSSNRSSVELSRSSSIINESSRQHDDP